MISPKAFPSYSQYSEDIILLSLLGNTKKGFYIDIGANYPTIDSVTKLFYDKGWRGINIEPIPDLFAKIEEERKNDININCAIGVEEGNKTFFYNKKIPGHSSLIEKEASSNKEDLKIIEVEVVSLSKIIRENVGSRQVDFMKIDVEGYEYEVINSNDWSKYRPRVLCIEANHTSRDWRAMITNNRYKLFIKDGLNEYYVSDEDWTITKGYAERAVRNAYHSLRQHQFQSWLEDSRVLKDLTKLSRNQDSIITNLRLELEETSRLSLSNVGYPSRIKRALTGLTIDWARYLKNRVKTKP